MFEQDYSDRKQNKYECLQIAQDRKRANFRIDGATHNRIGYVTRKC